MKKKKNLLSFIDLTAVNLFTHLNVCSQASVFTPSSALASLIFFSYVMYAEIKLKKLFT